MSRPKTIKITQLEKQVEDSEKAFRANLEAYNEMRSECGRLQSELSATKLELAIEREARQQGEAQVLAKGILLADRHSQIQDSQQQLSEAEDRAAKLATAYDRQTERMVALRTAAERVAKEMREDAHKTDATEDILRWADLLEQEPERSEAVSDVCVCNHRKYHHFSFGCAVSGCICEETHK
jgi:hypothetical protein